MVTPNPDLPGTCCISHGKINNRIYIMCLHTCAMVCKSRIMALQVPSDPHVAEMLSFDASKKTPFDDVILGSLLSKIK